MNYFEVGKITVIRSKFFIIVSHCRYDTAAEQATDMWYSEVEKYNFKKPSFQPGTGHFTQVG